MLGTGAEFDIVSESKGAIFNEEVGQNYDLHPSVLEKEEKPYVFLQTAFYHIIGVFDGFGGWPIDYIII